MVDPKEMEEKSAPRDSLGLKLALAGGGVLFALLLSFPFIYYFILRDDGAHYTSPKALRAAIESGTNKDGTRDITLRAFIQTNLNDAIMYELKPSTDVVFKGVPVHINAFGMRGPETTLEKPPGTKRIVLLGDSFAFGWGVNEEEGFARVMERELNAKLPKGQRVEVLNFGTPSYSTFQEVAHFFEKGIKFKPDIVLVFVVDNDFGLPFFMGMGAKHGNVLITARDYMKRVWEKDDEESTRQRQFLQNILDPNKGLQELAAHSQENGYKVFVAVNPGRTWDRETNKLWVLRANPLVHEINLRDDLLRAVKEQKIDPRNLSLAKDPHPSPLKHKIMGEKLAKTLLSELKQH